MQAQEQTLRPERMPLAPMLWLAQRALMRPLAPMHPKLQTLAR